MGGLEKFTIRRVGNPALENGKASPRLVRALFLAMQKSIGSRIASGGLRRTRIVFEPRSVARIGEFGQVEMEVGVAPRLEVIGVAAEALVGELFRSFSGDPSAVLEVFDLFWARLALQNYGPKELMSTLLMCIEEKKLGGKGAQVISSLPRAQPVSAAEIEIPRAQLEEGYSGAGNVGIRVVSVREMLREYFEKYPHRYHEAIEKALGGKGLESSGLESAIESEISKIGVWEFATRVWMLVRGWDMKNALGGGIIRPIDEKESWVLCPRWGGGAFSPGSLAHVIALHYKETA